MPVEYYAQDQSDWWIEKHLPLPERGFYVDVGCAWPDRDSNTAFLRERGWNGLAIDANRDYLRDWQVWQGGAFAHHFVAAVVSCRPVVPFQMIPHNALESRINEEPGVGVETKARTLDAMIRERKIGRIDLLSVDVEGAEYEVLKSIHQKHLPPIIIIEWNTSGRRPNIEPLVYLTQSGWDLVHATHSNFILYRPPERAPRA